MEKRKKYIGKGNTELNPAINPSDRILYEFDDAQRDIYSNIQKDLKGNFTTNILLGGVRGCGKSSLINLAAEFEKNLVVKIDCSIVDEDVDLLILITNELKKILDRNEVPLDEKPSVEVDRLIREITFSATNIYRVTTLERILKESGEIADFVAEVCLPFKAFNLKSSIRARLKEVLVSKKDETEELLQQRVTAYFERKTAFCLLIDKINEISGKKLVLIFDEIDKNSVEFLDMIFDKYKSFFTSGKTTNIFLISIPQYYHIMYGNACENIAVYFDKKYFLRAASFQLFKNISYNEIRSSIALEINYYLNQGVFRNVYADMEAEKRNISLMSKAKYYTKLAGFVNSRDELNDFIKEILMLVLNKVLQMGFIDNQLKLSNLKQICSEEFSIYKNIQLEELTLYVLKSSVVVNTENWINLNEDKIVFDYNIFEEKYKKDLYNDFDSENSSSHWEHYKGDELSAEERLRYNHEHKFKDINNGQIKIRNYADLEFVLIDDSNNSHGDIIKTLLYREGIKAFVKVKKENYLGDEFGYVFFIGSSINGKYVLYYKNASWSYEACWVGKKIDNFVSANNIKNITVEVNEDFKETKENLFIIIEKYNQHEKIAKDWTSFG